MGYHYALLMPGHSKEARAHNRQWLGPNTLGIEITSPAFQPLCGLGNMDPQHTERREVSAIEEALTFPLPPDGSFLVTERSDRDSLGAMQVLTERLEGNPDRLDKVLVQLVGVLDTYGGFEAERLYPELFEMAGDPTSLSTKALNAIAKIASPRWPSLQKKVEDTGRILRSEMAREEVQEIADLLPPRKSNFSATNYGGIAYVKAPKNYSNAREWAGPRFPVAVIEDPKYQNGGPEVSRRITVIKQTDAPLDMKAFAKAIMEAEAKTRGLTVEEIVQKRLHWGGPRNIVSSPPNTALSFVTVLSIALDHYADAFASR